MTARKVTEAAKPGSAGTRTPPALASGEGRFSPLGSRLAIKGMRLPLAFSFYRSGWAAVLPADALEVEEIASELGIRMADPDDGVEDAGGWSG